MEIHLFLLRGYLSNHRIGSQPLLSQFYPARPRLSSVHWCQAAELKDQILEFHRGCLESRTAKESAVMRLLAVLLVWLANCSTRHVRVYSDQPSKVNISAGCCDYFYGLERSIFFLWELEASQISARWQEKVQKLSQRWNSVSSFWSKLSCFKPKNSSSIYSYFCSKIINPSFHYSY